jgi:histidine ammonia-lyase
MPDPLVRLMMLFKVHALLAGHSGVRVETVRLLVGMISADLLPVVPTKGSLGASGDLAPLSHMVLPMIGRGEVRRAGERVAAAAALKAAGMAPISLGAKEGVALINGTQFMSAYAAEAVVRGLRLCRHADVIAAMSLDGFAGSIKPFDERLHALRPHPGAIEVAGNVRRLLAGSEILASHVGCDRVQDPYSMRCIPQVHGAVRDALRHVTDAALREINSVTDNPILFENGDVISGGNFHGQPIAIALDYLGIALAELAAISERRIYLLLSGTAGLPTLLMADTGVNSGFMLPQYTAAALVSENKILAHPASVDSIPTSLGQEDHVSMGATAAVKCRQILENAETVLAIEQMCAAQALDFRAPLKPTPAIQAALAEVRRHISHADRDRLFGDDIHMSLELLRSQAVTRAVHAAGTEVV